VLVAELVVLVEEIKTSAIHINRAQPVQKEETLDWVGRPVFP
jgi:hypothetical protein